MPGYWWECERCKETFDFETACGHRGAPHFIRDALIPGAWDQRLLLRECPKCRKPGLRITYEFPRSNKETLRVLHIVGLGSADDEYIPMMWESLFSPYDGDPCFDFKYIIGRSVFGLKKPAVFTQSELRNLFSLYSTATGAKGFP